MLGFKLTIQNYVCSNFISHFKIMSMSWIPMINEGRSFDIQIRLLSQLSLITFCMCIITEFMTILQKRKNKLL
jgi:hypothetical protein